MAIKYTIEKHAVVGTGRLLATNGGAHIYDIVAGEDRDNGSIVGLGDYADGAYKEADATTFSGKILEKLPNGNFKIQVTDADNAWLIATVPMIYEEYSSIWQDEANFYNLSGSKMTAIELKKFDEFEVSPEGISGEAAASKTVNVTTKKITVQED